ncbi:glycosyltransferase family 4 protein [Piscinibacter aquaticus]|uniref:Glycosyltransferase family 4 protein n=1 Tax=Piscinibacter aquaticus TaxID=392597 RepID=A0A5C6U0L7_9BURK|nr:glycosyltransferase family 4 protein [Piscinibacter aquaticus]
MPRTDFGARGLVQRDSRSHAPGLPVIASRAGGNVELIEDDATGVLFDVGDAEGLAAQIRRIAGDAQLRARLGHAAEASVARHYSVSAMAHRFASLYARALGSGRAQLA